MVVDRGATDIHRPPRRDKSELSSGGVDDTQGLLHDFGTDAITGQDCNLVFFHACVD